MSRADVPKIPASAFSPQLVAPVGLNICGKPDVSGVIVSVVTFCMSAASSCAWVEQTSICLRARVPYRVAASGNDFAPASSWANSNALLVIAVISSMTLVLTSALPFAKLVQLCSNRSRNSSEPSNLGISNGGKRNPVPGAALCAPAGVSYVLAAPVMGCSSITGDEGERVRLGDRRLGGVGCLDFMVISRSVQFDGFGYAPACDPPSD